MKTLNIVPMILGLCCIAGVDIPSSMAAAPATEIAWFQKNTQAMFDALAVGDKSIWDRTLADDCIFTTEDGEVFNKVRFLKELRPLPPGFKGKEKIVDLTVKDLGNAAVVHYLLDEHEDVFGQLLHTKYLETDTYRLDDSSWKLVAAQVTVVPRDLTPVKVDTRAWPALVGAYRLSDKTNKRYHVYMRHGSLYGGSDQKSATLLIPLSPLVFFQKGSIHTMVFVRDAAGAITEVLELHKYNEVVMRRVP